MTAVPSPPPEFSRPVDVTRLGRDKMRYELTASPAERGALAQRFGLLALDRLEAAVTLQRLPGNLVQLSALFTAEVVQSCVSTLEPVASHVEEEFTLLYGTVEEAGEVTLDGEAETVEPLEHGNIDLGEGVAQQLSLALDPFPRAPGAMVPSVEEAVPEDSPFAVLKRLRPGGPAED